MSDEPASSHEPITDERRADLVARWRRKIAIALDDDGYYRAGWGYPQSTPSIVAVNEGLRSNPDVLQVIHELTSDPGSTA